MNSLAAPVTDLALLLSCITATHALPKQLGTQASLQLPQRPLVICTSPSSTKQVCGGCVSQAPRAMLPQSTWVVPGDLSSQDPCVNRTNSWRGDLTHLSPFWHVYQGNCQNDKDSDSTSLGVLPFKDATQPPSGHPEQGSQQGWQDRAHLRQWWREQPQDMVIKSRPGNRELLHNMLTWTHVQQPRTQPSKGPL